MPGKLLFALVSWILMLGNTDSLLVVTYQSPEGHIVAAYDLTSGEVETLFTIDTRFAYFDISPTGDHIAYVTWPGYDGDVFTPSSYYVMALPDGEPRLLSDQGSISGTSYLSPRTPFWSPDGTQLGMFTQEGLLIASVDDTIPTYLLPIFNSESPIRWSPDGRTLMFNTMDNHANVGAAYVIPVDNSRPVQILIEDDSEGDIADFAGWMPDSRHILVNRSEGYSGGKTRYFTVDVETMQVTELSNTQYYAQHEQQGFNPDLYEYPYYRKLSPDGAYFSYFSGDHALQIFGWIDREVAVEFPLEDIRMTGLDWSPDSTFLVYTASAPSTGIYRVNVDGSGGVQQLSNQEVELIGWMTPQL